MRFSHPKLRKTTRPRHKTKTTRLGVEPLEDRRMLAAFELSSLLGENGGDGSEGFVVQSADSIRLGEVVSASGDVNGDGFDDLLVAAPFFDAVPQKGGPRHQVAEGAVFVVFGTEQGVAAQLDIQSLDGVNGFAIHGVPEEPLRVYNQIASNGDLNGDGIDDIALLSGETQYVLFGNSAWGSAGAPSAVEATSVSGDDGFVITTPEGGSFYYHSADMSGDVNGDGISDLIVGDASSGITESVVIYGRDTTFDGDGDGTPDNAFLPELSLGDLNGDNGIKIVGAVADDWGVFSVSTGGDLNGDGINDIVLGVPWGTPEAGTVDERVMAGQTFVLYGNANFSSVVELTDLLEVNGGDGSQGFVVNGIDGNRDWDAGLHDASGVSVYAGGDFNGDGIDDLAISAPVATNAAGDRWAGEAYVLFGTSTSFPATVELSELDGATGVTLQGLNEDDSFGRHVALEDINGDALADLVATAPGGDPGGRIDAGGTYVVFGSMDVPVGGNIDLLAIAVGDGSAGFVINGIDAGDESGGVNAHYGGSGLGLSTGDFNGDAYVDLAIGTDDGEEAYVLFGGEDIIPPPSAPSFSIDDVEVTEGDNGTINATFTVVRSGDSSETDMVDFATDDGSATTADNDYQAASGTLTFDPGVTSLPITVTIVGDTGDVLDETFSVNLSNPSAGASIADGVGVGTIKDDDALLPSLYIADIGFEFLRDGKDWRATVEVRSAVDDSLVEGVTLKIDFAGKTHTVTTNSSGLACTKWQRNLSPGDYYADAYDLALTGFVWNPFVLDLEDDSDDDDKADDLLVV